MELSNQIFFRNLDIPEDQSACATAPAPPQAIEILGFYAGSFVDDEETNPN